MLSKLIRTSSDDVTNYTIFGKLIIKGRIDMAIHHGGKVGKAAKTLASKSSSNASKSKAGTTLVNHKTAKH